MFLKFTLRALRYRKQRLLLSFGALLVAATLATVLFGIYGTVERRVRDEFGSYGANIVAVPAHGKTVPLELGAAAEKMGAQTAPFLITAGKVGAKPVAVAGFMPAKSAKLNAYWHVTGRSDIRESECLVGQLLAVELGQKTGQLALDSAPCRIVGVVATGGPEDGEVLVPMASAEKIAGLANVASVIQIRVAGERVEALRSALAGQFPGADIRTVRSVAGTESAVVLKVRAALFLLTLLILAITTLCVSSNFSEMVIERSKEIGILKALGAAEQRIATFFVSESAALAVMASVFGYLLGILAAAAIGRAIFGAAFHARVDWLVFLTVTAVMLGVAAVATALAASGIWRIQPAMILRGE